MTYILTPIEVKKTCVIQGIISFLLRKNGFAKVFLMLKNLDIYVKIILLDPK